MELSLAMEHKMEPTNESPAPVVSTAFTENPPTFPFKFYKQSTNKNSND